MGKYSREDNISKIRIKTTILATITGVLAALSATHWTEQATLILTLEVIILPAIYIIGAEYSEYSMRKVHNKLMDDLHETINNLEKKNNGLQIEIATLRNR